jgi:hypothetical protein
VRSCGSGSVIGLVGRPLIRNHPRRVLAAPSQSSRVTKTATLPREIAASYRMMRV